jgi:hypothetical protein
MLLREHDGSDSDDSSYSSSSSSSMPPSSSVGCSHFRRLRTIVLSKKRPRDDDPEIGNKRARTRLVEEPDEVRQSDAFFMQPHPSVIFVRDHTPVKPCRRCKECRREPCGVCVNCVNNAHLIERSRDRKRCAALGCTRLSKEELERYRLTHCYEDSILQIEADLRVLRDKFMSLPPQTTSQEDIKRITKEQDDLMERLRLADKATEALASQQAPEGYHCLLLSFQTLETERDRLSRMIDRRTTRDSPGVMMTRRQLRNFYALTICSMAKMFCNDVVARMHVPELLRITEEYENTVKISPVISRSEKP